MEGVPRREALIGGWAAAVATVAAGTALARRPPGAPATAPTTTVPPPSPMAGPMAAPVDGAPVGEAAPAASETALTGGAPRIGVDRPGGDGVPDRTPLTGEALVLHVARRASFGPTPELLADIRAAGPAAWLESQLAPEAIDDSALEGYIAGIPGFDALGWTNQRGASASDVDLRFVARCLRHATVLRAQSSHRQLNEVLVDLWSNHLNTWMGHPVVARYLHTQDRDVIRPHALGRFADLLLASARSPAMLAYLDLASSSAPAPNENYGRELLELHSVGVDAGFTESDVRGASIVLTGWTIDGRGNFTYDPGRHDASPAAVLGWSTPGRTGGDGLADGESLLSYLAHHPATARRVATVIARRFVADDPPADTVDEGAAAYLANDTDIRATVRAILGGSAFLAGGGPKLRRPFETVVAALRATGATVDPYPRNHAAAELDGHLTRAGHRLFDRAAPDGYPDRATGWASSSSLLARWSFVAQLLHGSIPGVGVDYARVLPATPATAGEVVDGCATALLGHPLAPERRAAIVGFLGVADGAPAAVATDRLPAVGALVLSSPEAEYR